MMPLYPARSLLFSQALPQAASALAAKEMRKLRCHSWLMLVRSPLSRQAIALLSSGNAIAWAFVALDRVVLE